MLFNKLELLKRASELKPSAIAEDFSEMYRMQSLNESVSSPKRFDIFLSHSYADREAVKGLADMLEKEFNFSVYLDWVVDAALDRTSVNKRTAEVLRNRLKHCKCLLYVTSHMSETSKWMPWETGYADGHNGKVAICPLVEGTGTRFNGLEYLSLYPYVDIANASGANKQELWINEYPDKYCPFESWLNNNAKPMHHK